MRACPRCGRTYPDGEEFCGKDGSTLTTLSDRGAPTPWQENAKLLSPGAVIGNYRVESILGQGGMGVVYAAQHTVLGRRVAVKVLRKDLATDEMIIKRFFHEARAAYTVGHENIVEVFDFIDTGDVRAYVMEMLEGRALSAEIATQGGLPAERVLRIAKQVAAALAAVHDNGIVHRDLKPDNIFLTERRHEADFVKLFDFGVAKLFETNGLKTEAGTLLGTPAYMAPEQLQGEELDSRADIYAFGVVLYEMVTGRRPFDGKSLPELLMKHVAAVPKPPSEAVGLAGPVPAQLERLILQCMAKLPADRPNDMHGVLLTLDAMELRGVAMLTPAPRRALTPNPGTDSLPTIAGEPPLAIGIDDGAPTLDEADALHVLGAGRRKLWPIAAAVGFALVLGVLVLRFGSVVAEADAADALMLDAGAAAASGVLHVTAAPTATGAAAPPAAGAASTVVPAVEQTAPAPSAPLTVTPLPSAAPEPAEPLVNKRPGIKPKPVRKPTPVPRGRETPLDPFAR